MNNLEYFLMGVVPLLFPFISGLVRLKKIRKAYRPFILLITIAVMTEIVSYITIELYKTNTVAINVYSLIECLLIIAQFFYWRFYSHTRKWYPWFGLICLGLWVADNLITGRITTVGSVFRLGSAFVLVVLSINEINYVIINENRNLLKNARFLICTGFLIYFLYQILLEGSIYVSKKERSSIIELSMYINILINLFYGVAIWFIPKKTSLQFKSSMDD